MKKILALGLLLSTMGAYADILIPPQFETKVKCATFNADRNGRPSDAELTKFVAKIEASESLSVETKSVSVTALNRSQVLACVTYRAENPQ